MHAVVVIDAIAGARLAVEAHVVGEAGAATALHTQAQPSRVGSDVLLRHDHTDARERLLGDDDVALGAGDHVRDLLCGRHEENSYALVSDATSTGFAEAFFFFQSPIAARIASSARTEQWIFTGGKA